MVGENEIDAAGATQGGFCIVICVAADGKITVESGPLDTESESTGAPVANIDEALAKVREMYAQSGGSAGDDDFNAGYGKTPAAPMMVREKPGMM